MSRTYCPVAAHLCRWLCPQAAPHTANILAPPMSKAPSTPATIVAEIGDYSRQCGQGLRRPTTRSRTWLFSATSVRVDSSASRMRCESRLARPTMFGPVTRSIGLTGYRPKSITPVSPQQVCNKLARAKVRCVKCLPPPLPFLPLYLFSPSRFPPSP